LTCLFISEAIIIYNAEEWALKLEARKAPGGEEAYVKELLDSRKEDANKSVLHYFDANNDIDPIHALIPHGSIELKVPNAGCRNERVLANYQDNLKKVKDLALEASKNADEKVNKLDKRNEFTFRKNHGFSQELADRWKQEPISNKRRRLKEEGLEFKIKAFLKSCAKESEVEPAAEVLQWQDRYIDNNNASYYLLNALDCAVRQGNGDYTTLLSEAIFQFEMKRLLFSIHAAFADNIYDFVHSGEQKDAFVGRFKMKSKLVFSQYFATYFVDKVFSYSNPTALSSSSSSSTSLALCASSL
jgi:hypothetical protein